MKGIIVRIMLTEITCRYHDNKKNIACTSCSGTKLPARRTAQLFTFFAQLCATVFSCLFPEGRENASLKSGISRQQKNVRLISRRNIFVMLPTIVYLVYHHKTIYAIRFFYFEVENGAMKTSLSSYLARRERKVTGILSSDW